MEYNPADWYWKVGADTSKVFSSLTGDYVDLNAAAYLAFLAGGGVPTAIGTEDELGAVLAPHSVRPSRAGILDAYKDAQAGNISIKVAAKILYFFANEIRSLKGQPTITPAQFRSWVKDLM